jgi:hypothetical protein
MRALAMKCEFGFGTKLDLVLTGDRPSLIPAFAGTNKLSYGPPTTFVVAPPSEGKIQLNMINKLR